MISFIILADYIGDYLMSRKARSIAEQDGDDFMTITSNKAPILPDQHKHAFHGGERAILYGIAEDLLSTFGVDGKACLLRTICEIHSKKSLEHFGFLGEVAKLFFTWVFDWICAFIMLAIIVQWQFQLFSVQPNQIMPHYWRNMCEHKRLAKVRLDRVNVFHITKNAQKAYSRAEEMPINTGELVEYVMMCDVWRESVFCFSAIYHRMMMTI